MVGTAGVDSGTQGSGMGGDGAGQGEVVHMQAGGAMAKGCRA